MSCLRRIKAGRVIIPIEEKMPTWSVAWGGPLWVTPGVIEILFEHAALLDPDDRLLTIMPRFFEQILWAVRKLPQMGKGARNEAELVGFELSTCGERGDVFLAVQVEQGALHLFAPSDLEDVA